MDILRSAAEESLASLSVRWRCSAGAPRARVSGARGVTARRRSAEARTPREAARRARSRLAFRRRTAGRAGPRRAARARGGTLELRAPLRAGAPHHAPERWLRAAALVALALGRASRAPRPAVVQMYLMQ